MVHANFIFLDDDDDDERERESMRGAGVRWHDFFKES